MEPELARGTGRGNAPVQVVREFCEAVSHGRIEDVLGLVDPTVICFPMVQPGRMAYSGKEGMIRLIADLHSAYGRFEYQIHEITEHDGPSVTARITFLPEAGRWQSPVSGTNVYTFRDGLIASIERQPTRAARRPVGRPPA
jgi:hypothetical protein